MAFYNLAHVQSQLRLPSWFRPFRLPSSCSVNLTVTDSAGTIVGDTRSVSEVNSDAVLLAYRQLAAAIDASALIIKTGKGGMRLASSLPLLVVFTYARLWARPNIGGSNIVRIDYDAALKDFSLKLTTPSASSVDEFALQCLAYSNPWNAFKAGLAWVQAPWAATTTAEIPCELDSSLPVLTQHHDHGV